MYNKETLTEWDRKFIWHPFTQMKDYMDMETADNRKG